jgi:carbon monoxide dehydrogenase subunit G
MPEVEYATSMALPTSVVWEFVKDMNNWAPMLTGYQKHEILDEKDSVWTLKGDVGILSRVVRLQAHITEWVDCERVSFTLTGLNEKVDGGGVLLMEEVKVEAKDEAAAPAPAPKAKRRWFGRRFMDWLARKMFKRMHGEGPKRLAPPVEAAAGPQARLTFTLRMDAGGPTGPLVNAMLGPALLPAAEDLANKIAAHLEREHLGTGAAAASSAA